MSENIEALEKELLELEAQLAQAESKRHEREQEAAEALQQERDEYAREYAEQQEKQRLLILKGQMNPFAWADGMYESLENL